MFKKNILFDVLHIKNNMDLMLNFFFTLVGGFVGYFTNIVNIHSDAFAGIAFVVFLDFFFGVIKAVKFNMFETKKALKVVYYYVSYTLILATMLSIEQGFDYAAWLAEAVMLPIIIFQIISAAKNASLVGLIPKGVLLKILENIDNYKDDAIQIATNSNTQPIEQ